MVEKLRTSCNFWIASKAIDRLTNHSTASTVKIVSKTYQLIARPRRKATPKMAMTGW